MQTVRVQIKRLSQALPLPVYQTSHAAGMDLVAALEQPQRLLPGARALIATGIAIALPQGYEAQVRPRSGLAIRYGLALLNSPGTIDADYRGEIKLVVINHGTEPFVLERGMRLAQLVVAPVTRCEWVEVGAVDDSARGAGGFGSTGL